MDNKKINSLNNELPQFFLEELEQRLETDPLSVGGLYDLDVSADTEGICEDYSFCSDYQGCPSVIICGRYEI